MENITQNLPDVDIDQVTEASQQVANGATDTVKSISDYFGVDTLIIWLVALVAIVFVWRVFKKLGKNRPHPHHYRHHRRRHCWHLLPLIKYVEQ